MAGKKSVDQDFIFTMLVVLVQLANALIEKQNCSLNKGVLGIK